MRYRGVRIGLLLVFVAALGSGGYRVFEFERRIAAEAERAREFDALSWTLAAGILELRAAQQAYVSLGQGESYWVERVSRKIGTLRSSLATLERVARVPEATDAANAAGSSLESFERMDAAVRDYVANNQRLMASDLIYTDGLELTAVIGSHVEAARHYDRASSDSLTRASRVQQVSFAVGADFIGLIITALLVSPVRAKENAPALAPKVPAPVEITGTDVDVLAGASLHPDAPKLVANHPSMPAAHAAALKAAAALCTTFGRVADTKDLPAALERAAELLDASGLIVWVASDTGTELRPAIAHGYSSATLARLGPIRCDDDNATALAFRNSRVEIVRGNGDAGGAIIAPLLGPTGCTGVLAAEVRNGKESSDDTRAIAEIVAALAAFLSASPAPPQTEEQVPARGLG